MVTIELNAAGKLMAAIRKKVGERVDDALGETALELEFLIKKQVKEDSNDTGGLVRSISTRKVEDNHYVVGSNLFYAPIIEYGKPSEQVPGKRRRMPPYTSLIGWVKRNRHKMTTPPNQTKPPTDEQLAYAVARKIFNVGIEGKHSFQKVLDRERGGLLKRFKSKLIV